MGARNFVNGLIGSNDVEIEFDAPMRLSLPESVRMKEEDHTDDLTDLFDLMVCPITDEACELWTKACDDRDNPVDYSIMRELQSQNPLHEKAVREAGRLCWGRYEGNDTCGVDVMVQIRTGQFEEGDL